jgi:2-methylcitrate dehydratase
MHFKLGLYEHQSAGAIQGVVDLVADEPSLVDDPADLRSLRITIYEPAFSIIGDPAKRDPQTRQSADHSMLYIVATLLRKAYVARQTGWDGQDGWHRLMLMPSDYAEDDSALFHPLNRSLMARIDFRHGGEEFDRKYPDGIPTVVDVDHTQLGKLTSGLVMYPAGHVRSTTGKLESLLDHKFRLLAGLGVDDTDALMQRFTKLADKSPQGIGDLYDFKVHGVSN